MSDNLKSYSYFCQFVDDTGLGEDEDVLFASGGSGCESGYCVRPWL